ncbi:MAG: choice-of-anchor L domain-containing protein, partial [Actinobacteria bacterium]|nr:choice-of-anchor L domain-containing protein [Actinomycetota bacterium]
MISMKPARRAHKLALLTAATLGCAAFSAPAASAAITTVSGDATGATALAGAIVTTPSTLNSASFDAVPPSGTPNATANAPLSFFPTNGSTFAILTSGDANLADDPNVAGSSGGSDGGAPVRGDTDLDVTILKVDLTAPANTNCLGLDFAFYSEEYPEYVGSGFNDAFIAELDSSTWTTSGSTISAPNNFAFDSAGNVVSINSSGPTAMTAANAAGTTYDGATVLLKASTAVTPGSHTLYLSIFDQGDNIYDSAAFVDNVHFSN